MKSYYEMIFKRRSIRKFNANLSISEDLMKTIKDKIKTLIPLDSSIRTAFKIVKREETTAKFGEYCILFYSENHPLKLLNAGYMLEQMDLFFTSLSMGACWYGIARTKEKKLDGLDYVIMIAFGKVSSTELRSDISQFNRKKPMEIWQGEFNQKIIDAAILAPSACNSQPWRVQSNPKLITIHRKKNVKTIMTPRIRSYFNMIDMGIFLCFIDILLDYYHIVYTREISTEFNTDTDFVKIAEYNIK